jgi:hypothetical protein
MIAGPPRAQTIAPMSANDSWLTSLIGQVVVLDLDEYSISMSSTW